MQKVTGEMYQWCCLTEPYVHECVQDTMSRLFQCSKARITAAWTDLEFTEMTKFCVCAKLFPYKVACKQLDVQTT